MDFFHMYYRRETLQPCEDFFEAMAEFSKDRTVQHAILDNGVEVSTVFLCINHRHPSSENKTPILFETLVRTPDGNSRERRYETEVQATMGHMDEVGIYMHWKPEPELKIEDDVPVNPYSRTLD